MNSKLPPANDTAMLDFVAEYVTEINSLDVKPGRQCVEVICSDEERLIVVKRRGHSMPDAFRKCISAAMKEFA